MGKAREVARLPNGPAFSAKKTSAQTFSTNAYSKVIFNSEDFDTANCYDTTAARFTPTVAGYYQINATVLSASGASAVGLVSIFRNGTEFKRGLQLNLAAGSLAFGLGVSGLVYCNGTTDFVEINVFFSGAGVTADTGGVTYFDGFLARMA
jgi:hypothetical protein